VGGSDDISRQGSRVTEAGRGAVFWLTGLSGSGKSTLAALLEKRLIAEGVPAYRLDGDELRRNLSAGLGFSMEDRAEHIRRVACVAGILKDAGLIALVSVISPLRAMRAAAKAQIGAGFYEVYVKASIETCISRDPKGLYKEYGEGKIAMMTGLTSDYEEPAAPDVLIDTEAGSAAECADRLYDFIRHAREYEQTDRT